MTQNNRNAISLKKKALLLIFISLTILSITRCFMRTYASSRVTRKSFYRKSELQMFLLISVGHTVLKYGVTIQSSTMVREMFRQITQKLWATWTWGLDKLFTYQSFVTFHFAASSTGRFPIYLVPCLLRDRENDLYRIAKKCHDFHRCCRWLHHYYSRGCHVRLYLMKLDSTSVISSCFLKEKGLYLRLWFQLN